MQGTRVIVAGATSDAGVNRPNTHPIYGIQRRPAAGQGKESALLFPRFVHLPYVKLIRWRAYQPAERIWSPHAASRDVVGDQRRPLAGGFCDRPGALVPRTVPKARLEAFRALRTGDAVKCREQGAWDDEEGVAHAVLSVAGALFARTGEGKLGEVSRRRPLMDRLCPDHIVPHEQH
eukprot:scaffold23462_cov66-Phaeocystis_antarctica.AAC.6